MARNPGCILLLALFGRQGRERGPRWRSKGGRQRRDESRSEGLREPTVQRGNDLQVLAMSDTRVPERRGVKTYLNRAPDVFLRLASRYSFYDRSDNLVHVLLQRKRVDILDNLVVVLGAQGLPRAFDERGMPLQRRVKSLLRL